ncbi:MAG: hypothetical protein LBJ63_07115 [Prevotellaceae bacterium]|jgi:hypothetical protein|nr:hypothetical protein [Prevotellaceae bacterium]
MYKKISIEFFIFVLFISNVWANAIRGIPYDTYDFNSELQRLFDVNITILGWNRNGYVLYEVHSQVGKDYIVQNLVDDNTIWHGSEYSVPESITIKEYITKIAKNYNIDPVVGSINKFPYRASDRFDNREYICYGQTGRIEKDNLVIDIFVRRNEQGIQKKIGTFWQDTALLLNNITERLEFWYVKSPFENRLAVIVLSPMGHPEWDETIVYTEVIFGCHLDVGFN